MDMRTSRGAAIVRRCCERLVSEERTLVNLASPTRVLAAAILASSMVFIDGTAVNVVLPILQRELHATIVEAQWFVEAYSLFLSALILVGGSLGDHFGRVR